MNRKLSKLTSTIPLLAAMLGTTTSIAIAKTQPRYTTHTAATELIWGDSGFGPQVSPVNGDPTKGKHVTYVKFTAGMATPQSNCSTVLAAKQNGITNFLMESC